MTRAVFRIIAAGPHVSVQDGGRRGMMRFGVPESGPMDRVSAALGNRALRNLAGAAGIEVSLGGLEAVLVEGRITVAVAGGGFVVEAAGQKLGSWSRVTLQEGDRIVIRRGPWGSWTYLAFAGQMQVDTWLGSAATHALSGLGGGALRAGQELVVEGARVLEDGAIPCPVWARPRAEVGVVLGPQDRFFGADRIEVLLGATFRLTDAYDRMGVRLRGPSLAPEAALAIPSEAVLRGSIQVAGDGVAAVLLADHQATGGYPKIATVVDSDLDGFVQLRPHAVVGFRAMTPERAVAARRARAQALARLLG